MFTALKYFMKAPSRKMFSSFVMKFLSVKVAFLLFILQISSSEINSSAIEKFILTSNTTLSIATIDNAENNFQFILQHFPTLPRSILRFSNRSWIENCTSFANTDLNQVHNSTLRKSIKLLSQQEKNDFIIFTTLKAIESALKCIVHPLTRFLIIVTDVSAKSTSITEQNLTRILNKTWTDNGALKVFISTYNSNTVHTYNPFYRNIDGSFGKLNSFENYTFDDDGGRNMKQINGYPLRMELFTSTYSASKVKPPKSFADFYGPDVSVARTTGKLWNATLVIAKNDGAKFGFKYANGTLTGALKSIAKREAEIAFVTFFIKDYETTLIEFSAPVYSDDLCLIVKKAGRIPQFILPLITFDESLWIALGCFYILGITFWVLIRLLNNKIHPKFEKKRIEFNLPTHFRNISEAFQYVQLTIDLTILTLGAPLRRFPRKQSERMFLSGICLLSLNIVSIFQSQLSTCYTHPMYYKNVDTLQQFADTGLNIIIKYPAMMTDIFPQDSSELYRTLYRRMKLHPNLDTDAVEVTDKMGQGGVTRKTTLKLSKESDLVHLVPECPRSYLLSYIHSKHWVFAEQLNEIILYLKNAGIINKWIDDINYDVKLQNVKKQAPVVHHRELRVDDFMLSFMILGGGSALSSCFFIIELWYHNRCRRLSRKR